MAKELRPQHEDIACDICGRTILRGGGMEAYLAPGGRGHAVCELCTDRAYNEGWIREAAHDEMPATTRRPDQRRGLFGRLRRRRDAAAPEPVEAAPAPRPVEEPALEESPNGGEPVYAEQPEAEFAEPLPPPPEPEYAPPPQQQRQPPRREARHVRAVPTNAQVKVERALELFNGSEHRRTIGGIAKTLGEPWVS